LSSRTAGRSGLDGLLGGDGRSRTTCEDRRVAGGLLLKGGSKLRGLRGEGVDNEQRRRQRRVDPAGNLGKKNLTRLEVGQLGDLGSAQRLALVNPTLVIKGGVLDGKPLGAAEVAKLADLESREVLMGKLAGAMLASLSQADNLLNAPIAQVARLAGALQAKRADEGQDPEDLAGGAGVPAAAEEAPAAEAADAPSDEVTEAPADETTDAPADAAVDAEAEAPAAEATAASDESDTTEA
jgi:hypothetical protein